MTQAQQWKATYEKRRDNNPLPRRRNYAWDSLEDLTDVAECRYQDPRPYRDYSKFDQALFVFSDGSAVFIRMGVEGKFADGDLPDDPPVFDGLNALL